MRGWQALTLLICLLYSVSALSEPVQKYHTQSVRQRFPIFLLMGGFINTSVMLDKPLHQWSEKLFLKGGAHVLDGTDFGHNGTLIERLGRAEVDLGLSNLFYVGGVISNSQKMKRVGVVGTEAVLAGGLAVLALKTVIGRQRPGHQSDNDMFQAFHGTNYQNGSFPSGHTTTAFALASVVAQEYKSPWITMTSYGIASTVGYSRIYQNEHWLTDVVGGAILGITVSKCLYILELKKNGLLDCTAMVIISS